MAEKRFYWLKLKEDFFDDKHIRFLRKMPDGDKLLIVYQRMQLLSLKTECIIQYSQLMPSCADELALTLDEEPEIVKFALTALQKIGLVEIWDDQTVYMSAMQELIGVEGSSAERVRRHREAKALQCNATQLQSNTNITTCNTEKRESKEQDKRVKKENIVIVDACTWPKTTKTKFIRPTLDEITIYCQERNNNIDPQQFIDYYSANGWRVGKNSMKDWKAAVRTWERNDQKFLKNNSKSQVNSNPFLSFMKDGIFDE